MAFDLTTISPIPPCGCKHISSPSRWRWLLQVVQVDLPPSQHPCMRRTGFASKAQKKILRCTNCRPCTQLSDAPIRARVLAFFAEHQPSQSSAGQARRTGGTGQARGVGIRSRRQFFHGRWLANHHTIDVDGLQPLQKPSWLARASCVSTPPPVWTLLPPGPWWLKWGLAGWSHTLCSLAMNHTHIRPRKNQRRRQRRAVCALQVLGLWRGG
jgi:hypothetical protein